MPAFGKSALFDWGVVGATAAAMSLLVVGSIALDSVETTAARRLGFEATVQRVTNARDLRAAWLRTADDVDAFNRRMAAGGSAERMTELNVSPNFLALLDSRTLLYVALSGSPIAPPGVDEDTLPPADKTADGIGVATLTPDIADFTVTVTSSETGPVVSSPVSSWFSSGGVTYRLGRWSSAAKEWRTFSR